MNFISLWVLMHRIVLGMIYFAEMRRLTPAGNNLILLRRIVRPFLDWIPGTIPLNGVQSSPFGSTALI
jgi:hypothetical protein